MTLELSIVADVFRSEAQAKHALEALRQAGFGYDQIGIAMRGHEGIDLQSDLEHLGVSPEQASYYAQEVKAGHTVISVRPDGREREAHEIMRQSGAIIEPDDTTDQAASVAKQKAAWDQAVASHQAYLAQQLAANTQEDFHQPRSLKPRVERQPITTQYPQAEEATLVAEQKPGAASALQQEEETTERKRVVAPAMQQQEEATEQQSSVAPVLQNAEVTQPKSDVAPVMQNDVAPVQALLVEEVQLEAVSTDDDEDTLRRLRNPVQESVEASAPQTQLEQPENKNLVKNGALLGGLLLGLAASIVVALLKREQIRQFVLSTVQTMK